jgi:hypothetical protein
MEDHTQPAGAAPPPGGIEEKDWVKDKRGKISFYSYISLLKGTVLFIEPYGKAVFERFSVKIKGQRRVSKLIETAAAILAVC